ncbi:hypothetical protein NPIL_18451 [Nephila pilipes]|uniref:Uncharacterized protein n=1 Tax=Nephila pilipes TaxID=299642 RepID=A0A8X6TNH1_NEPPI|nr:hypothetical protein NPIL_18451 [Nephila pilipes]
MEGQVEELLWVPVEQRLQRLATVSGLSGDSSTDFQNTTLSISAGDVGRGEDTGVGGKGKSGRPIFLSFLLCPRSPSVSLSPMDFQPDFSSVPFASRSRFLFHVSPHGFKGFLELRASASPPPTRIWVLSRFPDPFPSQTSPFWFPPQPLSPSPNTLTRLNPVMKGSGEKPDETQGFSLKTTQCLGTQLLDAKEWKTKHYQKSAITI